MLAFTFAALVVAQSLFGGLPIDGVQCNSAEGAVEHIHSRLQIFNRGHAVAVPQGVGISQVQNCLYWIHTHSPDGYIHIESPVRRSFTLGQFFDIWGADLSWTHAAGAVAAHGGRLSIWVNGKTWHGADPRSIVLRDQESIVIQAGPPFAKPAPSDWTKL